MSKTLFSSARPFPTPRRAEGAPTNSSKTHSAYGQDGAAVTCASPQARVPSRGVDRTSSRTASEDARDLEWCGARFLGLTFLRARIIVVDVRLK